MVPQRLSHGFALVEMEHLGCSNAVPNSARILLSTPDPFHGAKPVPDDPVKLIRVLSSLVFSWGPEVDCAFPMLKLNGGYV